MKLFICTLVLAVSVCLTGVANAATNPLGMFFDFFGNVGRPNYISGYLSMDGKNYRFYSGGFGPSIPYGDYPVTPGSIGAWGKANGALGIQRGHIWDPENNRYRTGIELHKAGTSHMTEGCVSIDASQWSTFRKDLLSFIKKHGQAYLHVFDNGLYIDEFSGQVFGFPHGSITTKDNRKFNIHQWSAEHHKKVEHHKDKKKVIKKKKVVKTKHKKKHKKHK